MIDANGCERRAALNNKRDKRKRIPLPDESYEFSKVRTRQDKSIVPHFLSISWRSPTWKPKDFVSPGGTYTFVYPPTDRTRPRGSTRPEQVTLMAVMVF